MTAVRSKGLPCAPTLQWQKKTWLHGDVRRSHDRLPEVSSPLTSVAFGRPSDRGRPMGGHMDAPGPPTVSHGADRGQLPALAVRGSLDDQVAGAISARTAKPQRCQGRKVSSSSLFVLLAARPSLHVQRCEGNVRALCLVVPRSDPHHEM